MKHLTAAFVGIVMSIVTTLITAATMTKIWEWFVARDYGPSPSYAAWFGIGVLVRVAITPSLMHLAHDKDDPELSPVARVMANEFGIWIGCAIILVVCWITGFALHWV